jgi:acetyl-CoA carboxylase biotin carboxyl carrier protein
LFIFIHIFINTQKMKLAEIQDLIKFVAKSGVSEVELENGDFKIVIKTPATGKRGVKNVPEQAQQLYAPPVVPQQVAPVAVPAPASTAAAPATPAKEEDNEKYLTIKSPMIGTFYRRPSPDKPIFANVGDEVQVGQVVCIIEAMKLFNEIESEISGKIVKVLVEDNTPVEYDQPLFLVDPS